MLTVSKVTKIFNRGTVNERTALNEVSLTLQTGDFVTVIGGNGAGKSTLLNCVAGVYPPDAGIITIDDIALTRLPEYKRAEYLGRVFQDPMMGTAADMNIEENLALAYRRGKPRTLRWGITAGERELYSRLLRSLDLGLEERMTSKVGLLSGGQRQALTLLMATLHKPKLLLLDEHSAALDPKTARKVLELSDRFIREGALTTMMVTHNMRDAIKYGNRLIMMSGGEIAIDVSGDDKRRLSVEDLLKMFERVRGDDEEIPDRMILG
ncbi:MAG: ABC transporter ATP-binding protein [Christensenellales bacterium]